MLCALVRPRLRGLSARQRRTALGLGLVVAAMNVTYFHAIAWIPIGVASSLELLGPLGLSLALSRRRTDLLWAALSAIGLSLLAITHRDLDVAGLVFGTTSGLLRAGYVLLNRRIGELFTDWSGLTLAMAAGAVVLAPLTVLTSGHRARHINQPDELAAGFGLGLAHIPIAAGFAAIAIQGVVASQLGLFIGARLGERFRDAAGRLAAIGLLLIGVYQLVEQVTG